MDAGVLHSLRETTTVSCNSCLYRMTSVLYSNGFDLNVQRNCICS